MSLKSITRFIALASLFLVPLFVLFPTPNTPFTISNDLFFPFITGKAFYFRILVEVGFMAWVVLAALDAKYRPKCNAVTMAVTIFAVVALVADLVGANPIRSLWSNFERMEGWIVIVHLWMMFMVMVNAFGSGEQGRKMWHNWMKASLGVATIVALYGFGQIFGWAAIHQSSSRVDASLGNAAYMAVYMLLNAGMAVYLLLESKARRASVRKINLSGIEWLYGILAVAFSILLIETSTRGTILGLIGGIMTALFVYAVFGRNAKKTSRYISGGIVIAVIVLIGLFIAFRHSAFVQKYEPLQRLASISISNTESVSRFYIWGMAIKGFEQRPVLGWGQENFNYVFNANYNPKMYGQEQWFDRAHSVYFDWLINGGILGLLAYLSLYVLFLYSVWKSSLTLGEKSALTGLLAGYAVHNIFVFDNLASYVLFFAFLGFSATLYSNSKTKLALDSSKIIKEPREISMEVVEYVIAPLAIIVLIFGIYFYNVRPLQENTRLISALQACGGGTLPDPVLFQNALAVGSKIGLQEIREQVLSCTANVINAQQIPNPTKQAFYELAANSINDQIAMTPDDARIYTLAGSFYEQIGAFDQALPLLEKAHLLSPAKQSLSMILGTAYINLGQYDKAEQLLKTTYEEETADTDARLAYATSLIIAGNDAQAQKMFGNDPSIFNTEQAAQAYGVAKQYDKSIAIYKNLIGTSTDQYQMQLRLAQTQYTAGRKSDAVATLQAIEKAHPEYKTQIDAMIKQVQQ